MIAGIVEWNNLRENTEFNGALEYGMLMEELDEFAMALLKTIDDEYPKDTLTFEENGEPIQADKDKILEYINSDDGATAYKVNQLDALGDILFVAVGAMGKLLDGNYDKVEDVMMAIQAANDTKGTTKNEDGKVTKPKDFVGPESIIKKVVQGG